MGVLINETCYKTGRVSTRDFTVFTTHTLILLKQRSKETSVMRLETGIETAEF